MREFKEEIHWRDVYYHQTLSDDFLIELQDTMNWTLYFINANSSFSIMKKYITKADHLYYQHFKLSHFNDQQINELQRILDLKNTFQKEKFKLKKTT